MKYAKLRGEILAKYRTNRDFAQVLNMSPATLSAKLNGRTEWTVPEMCAACKLLGIPLERAHEYFFCAES